MLLLACTANCFFICKQRPPGSNKPSFVARERDYSRWGGRTAATGRELSGAAKRHWGVYNQTRTGGRKRHFVVARRHAVLALQQKLLPFFVAVCSNEKFNANQENDVTVSKVISARAQRQDML